MVTFLKRDNQASNSDFQNACLNATKHEVSINSFFLKNQI